MEETQGQKREEAGEAARWNGTVTAMVSGCAGAPWEPQKRRSPGKLVNRNQLGERAQPPARGSRASSLKPRAVSEAGLLCQARRQPGKPIYLGLVKGLWN